MAQERGDRVIHKREPRWQSAADRARVAAELLEEAESLSENSTIATPAEVARASLPPPIRAELPDPAPPAAPEGEAPAGAEAAAQFKSVVELDPGRTAAWYYLGEALNHVDDLAGALTAFERAAELEPGNPKALYGCGIVLDRLNRPAEATQMYRRSREAAGR